MILLTGASGFLGTHFRLLCKARQIKLLCVYHTALPENPDSHDWIRADIATKLPDFAGWGITTIVHFAARISGKSGKLIQTNVCGTQRLVEFGEEHGIERFIFLSSDDIYFSDSWYAQSKRDAEDIVRQSRLDWSIVRCPTIFGQEDTKNFSQISRLVRYCPIVPVPFKGDFVWEPVFVGDVVRHVLDVALQSPFLPGRISIPVGPEKLSFREIIDQLIRHHGGVRVVLPVPNVLSAVLLRVHAQLMRLVGKSNLIDTFKTKLCTDQDIFRFRYNTKFSEIFPSK